MPRYQFCPRCGSKLLLKMMSPEPKKLQVCSNSACSWIHYDNPKPVIAAIIENNNQVLLVRRAKDPYIGDWDLPGGFVEKNETLEQAVKREVKEETHLNAETIQYYCCGLTNYKNADDGQISKNLDAVFLVTCQNTNPITGDDADKAMWFNWEQLPQNIAKFEGVLLALKKRQKEVLNNLSTQTLLVKGVSETPYPRSILVSAAKPLNLIKSKKPIVNK
jgi:mutator protein MutT